MNTLEALFAAKVEWLGLRKKLAGPERRSFARWIAAAKPDLAQEFAGHPAYFNLQCREIRRSGQPTRGLGQRTLERHATAIANKYLALTEDARGTFASFLERIARECANEAQLKLFLAS
jgi:hypothetical protein